MNRSFSLESFKTSDSPSGPVALPRPPANAVLRARRRQNRLSRAPPSLRGGTHTRATFLMGDGAQEDPAGALGPPAAGTRRQSWGHLKMCAWGRAGPRSRRDDGGWGLSEAVNSQAGVRALRGLRKPQASSEAPERPRTSGLGPWLRRRPPVSQPLHTTTGSTRGVRPTAAAGSKGFGKLSTD